mmetsp:Transcript_12200/g.38633  ORF Transcript_12200/g.38633 Transcript_12200/m.38633 type:complete len:432 (+) Transcript_12200:187-1482(+)
MADGYNWFLIIVAIVVTVLMGVMNVYILIHFQHPEDRNQAWLPKIVVVLGLTLAVLSVLMFPLDVGNRGACSEDIVLSACKFSLPMKELWMFVYMAMAILVLFVIPFTLFYYEADSEYTLWQKIWSASQWVIVTFIVVALTLGIAYGLAGYVEYDVEQVDSGMVPLAATGLGANLRTCLIPGCTPQPPSYNNCFGGQLCDGAARDEQGIGSKEEWSLRTSFPVYMIAVISILGWLLFMVFAGVGVFALPVDWIKAFAYRPRTTITRSEYISEAIKMEKRAKEVQVLAKSLRREEQERGKSRKWRKQLNMLNQQLVMLEEDETALREVYPQGEEREMAWTMTCIGYWGKLVGGILGCVVSLMWLIHVVLFMFISPPVHPFLNDFFIDLDGVFPLFGTAAFAFFCFYLMMITVKGCMTVGGDALLGPPTPYTL